MAASPDPALELLARADAAPMFARSPGTAELRGECPKDILNLLDAVSMARKNNCGRMTVVNEILGEWAAKKWHESSLIQKLSGGNPTGTETDGSGT